MFELSLSIDIYLTLKYHFLQVMSKLSYFYMKERFRTKQMSSLELCVQIFAALSANEVF